MMAIPVQLSNSLPVSETTAGAVGSTSVAAGAGHIHPRLTSANYVTLDGSGLATYTFTRTFTVQPAVATIPINVGARQVVMEIVSFVKTGELWTGVNLKGSRAQVLPVLTGIVLIGPLVSALSSFDVFGGSASGVEVAVIALMPS